MNQLETSAPCRTASGRSSAGFEPTRQELTDPLAFLPRSLTVNYRKGQPIFDKDRPSAALYLVIAGAVKVSCALSRGVKVVVRICGPEEFFGEASLLPEPHACEQAVALCPAQIMSWTANDIEDAVAREPRLGFALMHTMTGQNLELLERIDDLAAEDIAPRLSRALLRLSRRLELERVNGFIRMAPLTHEVLAQYIGTTRVIVTKYLMQFRREGLLDYSRDFITLYPSRMNEKFGRIL